MFVGTGAYLDDHRRQAEADHVGARPSRSLAIGAVAGVIAWLIGRSITRPLGALGARMQSLAEGQLDEAIPGIERGDEVGEMAKTVQVFKDNAIRIRGLEQVGAEAQQRAAAERRGAMQSIADDFERSVNGIVQLGGDRRRRHADHRAVDDRDRERRQRRAPPPSVRRRNRASNTVGTVAAAAEELSSSVARDRPSGGAVARDRQPGGRATPSTPTRR